MKPRILFLDDQPMVLQALKVSLLPVRAHWDMEFLDNGPDALHRLAEVPFAVVVSDMQMPEMNGVEFLAEVEVKSPDTIRIMLTGDADQKTARDAVNHGHIFRFLNKTGPVDELILALQAALKQHQLITAERELLERTLNGGVKILTDILSMLDPNSFSTGQRLREYLRQCLPSLHLAQTWDLELAAMLLQIGRVAIPGTVLERALSGGILTGPEKDMLARVPQIGADLLSNVPRLESVAEIVRHQNKNFDGTGLPMDVVAGDKIPLGSRILRILQDLLALEMRKTPRFEAFNRMKQTVGRYDPTLLSKVASGLGIDHPPEASAESETILVSFDKLCIGSILKLDLLTKDGLLIAAAETQVSAMLLEKLHNFAQLSGIREPICIARG
jgi:response regulator RpfG family c-di-GMP phosphodiesterase